MSEPRPLSGLDAAFLALGSETPYLVGAILVFDRPLDLAALRDLVDRALDDVPQFRQRIARAPLLGHPCWVDDEGFAIERHIQRIEAPAPIDLDRLIGERLGRDLPLDHPPWRLWLVDDRPGRSALLAVVHHALADGQAALRLLERLLRDPGAAAPGPRPDRSPGRAGGAALLLAELRRRAAAARRVGSGIALRPRELARAVGGLLGHALAPADDLGLNPRRTGRDRIATSLALELADVRRAARAFDATINDVVLAATAGALQAALPASGRRRTARALVPIGGRARGADAVAGNQVALFLADLPLDEPDPVRRLERVSLAMRALKRRSGQRAASEILIQLCDAGAPSLLEAGLRLALWRRAFNLVVTNLPGPPAALGLLGARLERIVPFVNLWPHGSLGVAVLSYGDRLHVGIQADRAVLPDLAPLARGLSASIAELDRAARDRRQRAS